MRTVSIRGRLASEPPRVAAVPQVSRLARMLALAYLVERLVEAGRLRDYAHSARSLDITRGRMTQIINLAFLPIDVQESILLGRVRTSERALRSRVETGAALGEESGVSARG